MNAVTAVATPPLMRVEDITLRFGGVTALSGVSFDIGASEIHAIIGPNGAGKSCTLNCLNVPHTYLFYKDFHGCQADSSVFPLSSRLFGIEIDCVQIAR